MQALADHEIYWLKSLAIISEKAWFEDGGDEFMAALITVIARQTDLEDLDLSYNGLSEEQKQKIRSAVTKLEPKLEDD